MRAASRSPTRFAPAAAVTVDVPILATRGRKLGVLCHRSGASHALPWSTLRRGETLAAAADRVVRDAAGTRPTWIEQQGAFGDGTRHPGKAAVSVCFVSLASPPLPGSTLEWMEIRKAGLPERQQLMVLAAGDFIRARMDVSPVAFHLLASRFTLAELQAVYEILLGRTLHKASFRRALHAGGLVEPTQEWRTEGRGRPAQLFRYASRRRRRSRPVRFDVL